MNLPECVIGRCGLAFQLAQWKHNEATWKDTRPQLLNTPKAQKNLRRIKTNSDKRKFPTIQPETTLNPKQPTKAIVQRQDPPTPVGRTCVSKCSSCPRPGVDERVTGRLFFRGPCSDFRPCSLALASRAPLASSCSSASNSPSWWLRQKLGKGEVVKRGKHGGRGLGGLGSGGLGDGGFGV